MNCEFFTSNVVGVEVRVAAIAAACAFVPAVQSENSQPLKLSSPPSSIVMEIILSVLRIPLITTVLNVNLDACETMMCEEISFSLSTPSKQTLLISTSVFVFAVMKGPPATFTWTDVIDTLSVEVTVIPSPVSATETFV